MIPEHFLTDVVTLVKTNGIKLKISRLLCNQTKYL